MLVFEFDVVERYYAYEPFVMPFWVLYTFVQTFDNFFERDDYAPSFLINLKVFLVLVTFDKVE